MGYYSFKTLDFPLQMPHNTNLTSLSQHSWLFPILCEFALTHHAFHEAAVQWHVWPSSSSIILIKNAISACLSTTWGAATVKVTQWRMENLASPTGSQELKKVL